MLKYVREQLAKQNVFAESTVPADELDDSMFVEAAHVLEELSDLSSEGTADHDSVRDIRGISIPVQEDFDIELDTVEFCMADGRMQDIPGDASALQESYYNSLREFSDFYAEAYNSTSRLPRESEDTYMDRVFDTQLRMYNEYMDQIVQEGLFGFGEISLSSSEIVWRVHINFGQLRTNGGEEYNATLPVLYEASKKDKILKKQLECVKFFDYCKIGNAREGIVNYAEQKGIKLPNDGNVWDVITPNAVFIPKEQNSNYTMYIRYKVTTTGEEIFFEVSTSMKNKKSTHNKSVDNDIIDSKDQKLEMKRKDVSVSGYVDKQTFTESYVETHMPSRWDRGYYQEAIDFGGGGDPPEMATATAAPAGDVPPAPAPTPAPTGDTANAQPAETNINIDLPPEEGQGDANAAPTQDNNQPADPPAPENPNTNDVSDQIASGVNEELEKQNSDTPVDLSADVNEEPNFDMSMASDPGMNDIGEPPTEGDTPDVDDVNAELNNEETGMPTDDASFDNMTLNQLIEQAQEKAKDMTIDQLKAFLMDNTMPNGEEVGAGSVEDGVQESFIYTKSNINKSMDELLRTALGILNDDKLELSTLIKKFKKNGKKLNKCLTKACKMDSVYDVQERKQISLLNRCLVDLMSMVKADSSASNTQTAKRLVKAFVSQAEAVGQIIERHKTDKEKVTQEGAITALFNVRENLERKANFVHMNVTLPIKNKVEADKLTVAFIKSYFKSDVSTRTNGNASAYDSDYGTYGTASSTTNERETDNPRIGRLEALTLLGQKIESKDKKRAKFSEEEIKNINRASTLAIELRDDIKSILKVETEGEASKLLDAIGKEACELDDLCKTFKK